MALKDVQKYFDKVAADYSDMLAEVRDFEDLASKSIVSPEQLDQFKQILQPLKDNYERISFIMFLLNQPVNKKKIDAYKNRNKKVLNSLNPKNSINASLNENQEVLDKLRQFNS